MFKWSPVRLQNNSCRPLELLTLKTTDGKYLSHSLDLHEENPLLNYSWKDCYSFCLLWLNGILIEAFLWHKGKPTGLASSIDFPAPSLNSWMIKYPLQSWLPEPRPTFSSCSPTVAWFSLPLGLWVVKGRQCQAGELRLYRKTRHPDCSSSLTAQFLSGYSGDPGGGSSAPSMSPSLPTVDTALCCLSFSPPLLADVLMP